MDDFDKYTRLVTQIRDHDCPQSADMVRQVLSEIDGKVRLGILTVIEASQLEGMLTAAPENPHLPEEADDRTRRRFERIMQNMHEEYHVPKIIKKITDALMNEQVEREQARIRNNQTS